MGVDAARLRQQRVVRAQFGHLPPLHDHDAVRFAYGRQAVGDDQHGAPRANAAHIVLDDLFRFIIERARRLVENQDARIADQGAGDGDALALAARQARAVLAHHGVVAFGQFANEIVGARQFRHGDDGINGQRRVAQGDVVAHGAVEEDIFLQHHADLAPQRGRVDDGDILPVDQHLAPLGNVQALRQPRQGTLARTGTPDDADHFARRDADRHIAQHLGRIGPVAETHLLELDGARDARQECLLAARFRSGIENIAQPAHGNAHLLEIVPQLRQPQDGRGHLSGQHVEGDQFAHRHSLVDHEGGAPPHDDRRHQLADQGHATAGQHADVIRRQARRHIAGQLLFPLLLPARFHGHGLERIDAADGFDQERLVFRAAVEFVVQSAPQHGREQHRQGRVDGNRGQHDDAERRAVPQHGGNEDEGKQQVQHHGHGVAGEKRPDVFQFMDARHGIAHAARLEIRDRQGQQVAEQARAQFHVDLAAGARENIGADEAQQGFEDDGAHEADGHHVQGFHRVVDQHLVHHHLEKQGRGQADQLQHEGNQQYLAQQPAVFDDGGDEPAEVETGRLAREAGLAGEKDQLARPGGKKRFAAEDVRRLARMLDQYLAHAIVTRLDLAEDKETAVRIDGDGRQRRLRQSCGRLAHQFGRQAKLPGGQQHGLPREHGLAEGMLELGAIGGDAVQAGHQLQRQQARVGRGFFQGRRIVALGEDCHRAI